MRKISLIIFILLSGKCFSQQDSFYIKVTINGLPDSVFTIQLVLAGEKGQQDIHFKETISPKNNTVIFSGSQKTETMATVQIKRIGSFDFAIASGDTAIITLMSKKFWTDYKVSGTSRPLAMINYLYSVFLPQSKELLKQETRMDSLKRQQNLSLLSREKKIYDSLVDRYYQFNTGFADTTCSATAVYFALFRYLGNENKHVIYPQIESAYNRFGDITPIRVLIADNEKQKEKKTNFNEGEILSIKKYFDKEISRRIKKALKKNKFVLIDFWASWCGPCREEFPFLNAAYKEFKSKGFEIISISFDEKKEAWDKAWASSKNLWKLSFLDSRGWQSPTVKQLNIKSIPRNYLIDANGKIYAKDLRGTELIETLRKLL